MSQKPRDHGGLPLVMPLRFCFCFPNHLKTRDELAKAVPVENSA